MDFVMVAIMRIINELLRDIQDAGLRRRQFYILAVGFRARAANCSAVRVLRHIFACRTPVFMRSSGIASWR